MCGRDRSRVKETDRVWKRQIMCYRDRSEPREEGKADTHHCHFLCRCHRRCLSSSVSSERPVTAGQRSGPHFLQSSRQNSVRETKPMQWCEYLIPLQGSKFVRFLFILRTSRKTFHLSLQQYTCPKITLKKYLSVSN